MFGNYDRSCDITDKTTTTKVVSLTTSKFFFLCFITSCVSFFFPSMRLHRLEIVLVGVRYADDLAL